jgi:hypothetical protein
VNDDLATDRAGTVDFVEKRGDLRMSLDGRFIVITHGQLGYYQLFEAGPELYTSLVDVERRAMARPQVRLHDDERAYLAANLERCPTCEHLQLFHNAEFDECDIPVCDCGLRRWRAEHEGYGHTITQVPAGTSERHGFVVTSERYNCSCRSTYEIGATA